MRDSFRIAALSLILGGNSGCGTLDSAPALACAGTELASRWYQASNNEIIEITSSCQFKSTVCALKGSVAAIDTTAKTLTLGAISTAFPGDPSCNSLSSSRTCSYTLSAGTLVLTCTPEGSGTYTQL